MNLPLADPSARVLCHTAGMRITPLLLILGLAACAGESYFEGAICPAPDAIAAFEDGDDLEVQVILDDCPPGCAGDFDAACSVMREGNTIELDARGSFRKRGGACTAACQPVVATCIIGNVPAGTYTINSGSHSLEVTLPSDEPPNYEATCPYD